mmetsp:Transcript_32020/g.77444  ORF Transcript_32020/g.77444 Transcript_32020/m.77444 type:complete len:427 (+) Transcript_32020:89-1369(+)
MEAEMRKCFVCRKAESSLSKPMMMCSCKGVYYCGKECQVHDFPSHKEKCTAHWHKHKEKSKKAGGAECWKVGLDSLKLGKLYLGRDMLDESEAEIKQAISIFVQHKGEENDMHARALTVLGNLYSNRSQTKNALLSLGKALEISRLVDEDEQIAGILRDLGTAMGKAGLHERALEKFQEAHDIFACVYGERHEEIAKVLHNMGLVLDELDKSEEAIAKYELSMEIKKEVLGEDSFSTSTTLLNIGALKTRMGRLTEAYASFEEGLAMARRLFAEHSVEGRFLTGMGDARLKDERYREAHECYEGALRVFRRTLGAKHPEVARVLASIAQVHLKQDNHPQALARLQESYTIRREGQGPRHVDTAQALCNIALVKDKLGDRAGSVQALKDALIIYDLNGGGPMGPCNSESIRAMLWGLGQADGVRYLD